MAKVKKVPVKVRVEIKKVDNYTQAHSIISAKRKEISISEAKELISKNGLTQVDKATVQKGKFKEVTYFYS